MELFEVSLNFQIFTRFGKFTKFSPGLKKIARFSPGFHQVFTKFLKFTKFSPGFHQVYVFHQVFTRFNNFTKFSPGFHQAFTKFRNFTRFSPSFGNFTVISPSLWISPGFHQVFFSQHCIQISPWKLFFFTKFTMKTLLFFEFEGVKLFFQFIFLQTSWNYKFHQVFTKFMDFTKFSPGLGNSPSFHQV